ncbi:hypothetical protein ACO0OL_003096 [Hanseniaspora opuntiae]
MLVKSIIKQPNTIFIYARRNIFLTTHKQKYRDDKDDKETRLYPKSNLTKFSQNIYDLKNTYSTKISSFKKKLENIPVLLMDANKSINKVTGYDTIQSLKSGIKSIEIDLYQDRISLERESKKLKSISLQQNTTQNLINDLLSRKSTWSPNDLKAFTETYNENQQNIHNLENQKRKVEQLEKKVKIMEQDVHNLILKRYHEEQIWSDKIRKLSTYGTLLLLVINLLSFFALHLLFGPRKRRKLVEAFEKETVSYVDDIKREQSEHMKIFEEQISHKLDALLASKENKSENSYYNKVISYLKMVFRTAHYQFMRFIEWFPIWKY